MIIIIPLGGIGKRFSELGYKDPKPLVKVLGKEIIFWVLDNLKINNKDKVYIVYNKELDNFDFTDHFEKYPYLNFLRLNRNTKGPVETIYEITKILEKNNNNEGVLIIDGDTFYKKNIIKVIKKKHTQFFIM
jgi:NDP-sugar pyrophosphorylase family protein